LKAIFLELSTDFHSHIKPINAAQLLSILRISPYAFESADPVRMSTKCYNKMIDNKALLLLPYPMFRSSPASTNFQSPPDCPRFPLFDLLSVDSAPSVSKADFNPNSVVPSSARTQPNPFRIRSYKKAG